MDKLFKKKEGVQPREWQPEYVPPAIITYNGDDLLEELGLAQTCTGDTGCPGDAEARFSGPKRFFA